MPFWLIRQENNQISLKILRYSTILFLFISCEDIGKGYSWSGKIPIGFSRNYGTIGYDYGWNATYSPFDEGIVIVGKQSPQINGQSDFWVIKTDSRGLLEWEKTYGGAGNEDGVDCNLNAATNSWDTQRFIK